jgi:tetratricopeptide (TPR) repeat protein
MTQRSRTSIGLVAVMLLVSISVVAVALVTNVMSIRLTACLLDEHKCHQADEADHMLATVLGLWPANSSLLRQEGLMRLFEGDYVGALAAFDSVIRPNAVTRFFWAQALHESGEHDQAIRLWRELGTGRYFASQSRADLAITIGPVNFELLYQLGEQAWGRGEYEDAAEYYSQALSQSHVESVASLLAQVRVYEFEQRWTDAEETYKRAILLYPNEPTNYVYLGRLYERQLGQPDMAIQWYDRCIAQPNCFELAYLWAGDIYLQRNQPARAIDYFAATVSRWPQNPSGWMGLGLVQVALGDSLPALDSLQRAEELFGASPAQSVVAYGQGKTYAQLGEWNKAVDFLEKSIQLGNRSVDVYLLLAKAHCMEGQYLESAASYRALLEIEPDNLSGMSGLEAVLTRSGCS